MSSWVKCFWCKDSSLILGMLPFKQSLCPVSSSNLICFLEAEDAPYTKTISSQTKFHRHNCIICFFSEPFLCCFENTLGWSLQIISSAFGRFFFSIWVFFQWTITNHRKGEVICKLAGRLMQRAHFCIYVVTGLESGTICFRAQVINH